VPAQITLRDAARRCRDLRLPARRGRRDRIVGVQEAIALMDALPIADRALWGSAFWAGLRHGELKALTWENVDLAGGTIEVRSSWDQQVGPVAPKSRAGARRVPIVGRLRDLLTEHRIVADRDDGLVFGRSTTLPFQSGTVNDRARRIWAAASLNSIGLHEARHTAASFWIAARLNIKTVSVYMGHASVAFTLDRYGHLLPGNEAESVERVDAFIERATRPRPVGHLT
jgi:integrase